MVLSRHAAANRRRSQLAMPDADWSTEDAQRFVWQTVAIKHRHTITSNP
jgi:hypothetical protein